MSKEKKPEIKIYTPLDIQKDYFEKGGQFSSNIPLYVSLNELTTVKAEIAEYRQRLEENVKCIESMLHHNSVQKAEIERLTNVFEKIKGEIECMGFDNDGNIIQINRDVLLIEEMINIALTKKEGNNG